MKSLMKNKKTVWILAIILIVVLYFVYKKRKETGKKLPFNLGGTKPVAGGKVEAPVLSAEATNTSPTDATALRVASNISLEGDNALTGNRLNNAFGSGVAMDVMPTISNYGVKYCHQNSIGSGNIIDCNSPSKENTGVAI